ncbi:MAG: SpoIVB peptidase [Clostridiales bacterium]|nr:SpoIVB peptidase [Clostridiales bacterium]
MIFERIKKRIGAGANSAIKTAAVLLAFCVFALDFGPVMEAVRNAPEVVYAESEEELISSLRDSFSYEGFSVTAGSLRDERLGCNTVVCRLFGLIPVKAVSARIGKRPELMPGGVPVGISIYTDGVLIVGLSSFTDENGRKRSPAADAGMKAGDVILLVGGRPVATAKELEAQLEISGGNASLIIERNGKRIECAVSCGRTAEGEYRIGAWVRDSTVGVGTLSFCDKQTGAVAALGHAVTDADTGALLKVKDGKLVIATLLGVSKGRQGAPGELHGTFDENSPQIGEISANTELGIFGRLTENGSSLLNGESIPVAFPDEVRQGEAYVLSSIEGEIRAYSCLIVKTLKQNEPAPKGLVIEVTDERLKELTGGIVQGMSGSPIIQDGRLVGAVTHVFVNDPEKGYGAYAYWMYSISGG